jgi:hypothetical protein
MLLDSMPPDSLEMPEHWKSKTQRIGYFISHTPDYPAKKGALSTAMLFA